MKAIKITTDNEISVVTVPEPTWKGMGQLVGGDFEHVRPWGLYNLDTPYKEKLCMIVNEQFMFLGLERNVVGTILYNDTPTLMRFRPIQGDILIMMEGFVNGDGEPDIVGMDDEQLIIVMIALKEKFDYLMEVIEEDEIEAVRTCRVCGCTDDNACLGGCYWVEEDLCSECVEVAEEDMVEEDKNVHNS